MEGHWAKGWETCKSEARSIPAMRGDTNSSRLANSMQRNILAGRSRIFLNFATIHSGHRPVNSRYLPGGVGLLRAMLRMSSESSFDLCFSLMAFDIASMRTDTIAFV